MISNVISKENFQLHPFAADQQETPEIQHIINDIIADPMNQDFTSRDIQPLVSIHQQARIVLIGQAPGRAAQDSMIPWNDRSGDRLRQWMGIDKNTFYQSDRIAIMNMDFYYPGSKGDRRCADGAGNKPRKGPSSDLPPRSGFAEKWHPLLLEQMPNVKLILLIGFYAVRKYLGLRPKDRLTDVVKDYQGNPLYFPLVHPSPRNQIWMTKNPWFAGETLPLLKRRVRQTLDLPLTV